MRKKTLSLLPQLLPILTLQIIQTWDMVVALSNSIGGNRINTGGGPLLDPNFALNYASAKYFRRLEAAQERVRISQDVSKVTFHLWTPHSKLESPIAFNHNISPDELSNFNFDVSKETKILCHGFSSDISFSDMLVKEYLDNEEHRYNIIGVGWEELATTDNYFKAAENTIAVGEHIGRMFSSLMVEGLGMDPKLFHFIGHSLGAHVGGHFGRTVASIAGKGKIGRLTGLDPAAPWFDITSKSNRMSRDDAEFVDVIHTNSGSLFQGGLSFMEEMGHVDFYPNGGRHQPGCTEVCGDLLCLDMNLIDWMKGGCSHFRAVEYYAASIQYPMEMDIFVGHQCGTWEEYTAGKCLNNKALEMAEGCDPPVRNKKRKSNQVFYLKTSSEFPFNSVDPFPA